MRFKRVKKILLATNLSENSRSVFEFAAGTVSGFEGTLIFLHVIEKQDVKTLFGDDQWKKLIQRHKEEAQNALIAQKSTTTLINEALHKFCYDVGVNEKNCGYDSKEIIVVEGDIVEEIINQAEIHDVDLIVMGMRTGFFHDNTIGNKIKGVMRKSRIPVTVVPCDRK
ncbi:universal stress protein [uncultured Desulfosarcina sp.]|uniref:universal stress protein n=1 Tax=uncultured Desulfosarcina sp. TaxID=218289 RepID=UPI0029C7E5AC|nr:universal stress protein [uncultured Desulfosarcina sp.]